MDELREKIELLILQHAGCEQLFEAAPARRLADEILRSLPGAGEWSAIESAPKDGTFLVYRDSNEEGRKPYAAGHSNIGVMRKHPNVSTIDSNFAFDLPAPTHWLSFDALPPSAEGGTVMAETIDKLTPENAVVRLLNLAQAHEDAALYKDDPEPWQRSAQLLRSATDLIETLMRRAVAAERQRDLMTNAFYHKDALLKEALEALERHAPADKLRKLADWFDADDERKGGDGVRGHDVQDDLRIWAQDADRAASVASKIRDGK